MLCHAKTFKFLESLLTLLDQSRALRKRQEKTGAHVATIVATPVNVFSEFNGRTILDLGDPAITGPMLPSLAALTLQAFLSSPDGVLAPNAMVSLCRHFQYLRYGL